ncbi:hypothetical protein CK203_037042 [Vitis vinifera]|uniref:Serine/threonine-protein phosphatase 7 long form-like n=1 Tax=Vitis vinifera TaxID=29760 RepID=A0A438I5Z4_VITVI|nr:hypothetical protein CK203_037042 [Vitis vinifera]
MEQLHVGRPSRSLPHAPVPVDERFPPYALGRYSFNTPIDSDLHSIDQRGRPQFDWRLYHEHYVALWEARGDHIVTAEPIGPHMDYHAPYMTWTLILMLAGTGIVDIIRMTTDVMCIIREDYRLSHVEHGGDRSPTQSTVAQPPLVRGRSTSRGRGRYSSCQPITSSVSASLQPPTFLSSRLVQSPISSNVPSVQHPTSSDPPSAQPLTSSDPPSVQLPTSLDLPPLQPPTSSDPPLVQIDTSTQLRFTASHSKG